MSRESRAPRPSSGPPAALATRLTVAFGGRPIDHALLWWRGALLTLLSLGLYLPWAWQACRQWRLNHTRIGEHRLACTLAPRRLLPLVFALQLQALATWQAWMLWGGRGLAAGLALVLASLPGLQWHFWRLSWGHLHWRGMPVVFDGRLAAAWRVLAPLPWLGATGLALPWLTSQVARHAPAQLPPLLSALLPGAALAWPWAGALPPLLAGLLDGLGLDGGDWVARALRIGGPTLVLTAGLLLLPLGWPLAAGLQDLTLSHARTARLQMHSHARTPQLARMAWQEMAAVACTAGLWWPMAQLRWWRWRIASVSVLVQGDPSRWHGSQALPEPPARGRARTARRAGEGTP